MPHTTLFRSTCEAYTHTHRIPPEKGTNYGLLSLANIRAGIYSVVPPPSPNLHGRPPILTHPGSGVSRLDAIWGGALPVPGDLPTNFSSPLHHPHANLLIEVVDGLNATDKRFLLMLITTVRLSSASSYDAKYKDDSIHEAIPNSLTRSM